jgi:hypothetical protein
MLPLNLIVGNAKLPQNERYYLLVCDGVGGGLFQAR